MPYNSRKALEAADVVNEVYKITSFLVISREDAERQLKEAARIINQYARRVAKIELEHYRAARGMSNTEQEALRYLDERISELSKEQEKS